MEEYRQKTVDFIKSKSERLSRLSDDKIKELYWMWSEETYCAGWMQFNEKSIEQFIIWATTSPIEREVLCQIVVVR